MLIEKAESGRAPEQLLEQRFDAIVVLLPQGDARPFEHPLLQWLDWKLGGAIARAWLDAQIKETQQTILATLNRIPTPYVLLHAGSKVDLAPLFKNCAGLKLKELLLVPEKRPMEEVRKLLLEGKASKTYPEKVWVGAQQHV